MRSELSTRQLQTLQLIAAGLTDQEIAEAFRVGIGTVYRHVVEARMKLDTRNRAHAVAIGYRRGLLM